MPSSWRDLTPFLHIRGVPLVLNRFTSGAHRPVPGLPHSTPFASGSLWSLVYLTLRAPDFSLYASESPVPARAQIPPAPNPNPVLSSGSSESGGAAVAVQVFDSLPLHPHDRLLNGLAWLILFSWSPIVLLLIGVPYMFLTFTSIYICPISPVRIPSSHVTAPNCYSFRPATSRPPFQC